MNNKQEIQIALEPVNLALSLAFINYDQETFLLTLISGTQGRNYILSPMHTKRLMLLLQKHVGDYENKFGELNTKLPVNNPEQTSESKIGFRKEE